MKSAANRVVLDPTGRKRAWMVWVLMVALLVTPATQQVPWRQKADDIEGVIELTPGESAFLRFRTSITGDEPSTGWDADLGIFSLDALEGEDSGCSVGVQVVGQQVGSESVSCTEVSEEFYGRAGYVNNCYVTLDCSSEDTSCEETAVFELTTINDASVRVYWSASASLTGATGCCKSAERAGADITLEQVE